MIKVSHFTFRETIVYILLWIWGGIQSSRIWTATTTTTTTKPRRQIDRTRSNKSLGSTGISSTSTKSSEKYSSGGMSVASNKSGKFSIGSGGSSESNYRKDLWLDVPNIT
mmetsp:Transcript_25490/g.38131  ORF Transcript_25490/g.38131 Transcript_25490/m.38131 type:complete len:110 (-) Transcript_25490:15-344(-)